MPADERFRTSWPDVLRSTHPTRRGTRAQCPGAPPRAVRAMCPHPARSARRADRSPAPRPARRRRRLPARPSVRRSRPASRRARRGSRTRRRGAGCSRRRGRASGQSRAVAACRLEEQDADGDADVQRPHPPGERDATVASHARRTSGRTPSPPPRRRGRHRPSDPSPQRLSASAATPYTQSSAPLIREVAREVRHDGDRHMLHGTGRGAADSRRHALLPLRGKHDSGRAGGGRAAHAAPRLCGSVTCRGRRGAVAPGGKLVGVRIAVWLADGDDPLWSACPHARSALAPAACARAPLGEPRLRLDCPRARLQLDHRRAAREPPREPRDDRRRRPAS